MKKTILFFIQNGVGGAERMTINIANLLSSDQYDIIFCKISIPFKIQNGRIDDFIPKGIKLTNISCDGQFSFLRNLYKVIKTINPDIVFSSCMAYNQRLLLLSIFFPKTKFIVRNENYLFTISKIKRLSIRYTYRKANVIIAQTEEMKDELIKLGLKANKIAVLHNIIDERLIDEKASFPSPFPNDSKIRFVSVGRLTSQKGFDILIKAFKIVSKKILGSELYIIGEISGGNENEYSNLKKLTEKLDLTDTVNFIGYTDNPYIYIKNASVYVLSSRFEGLPNVLIEAQFLGTPIAATRCIPIISRMVKDGANGFLAEPENPESLAKAMLNSTKINNIIAVFKPTNPEDFRKIFC